MKEIMCYNPVHVTPDDVYYLFTFNYGLVGSNAYQKQVKIALNFALSCACKEIECTLEDFLQFFCGCRSIPPTGFDQQCTIEFLADGNLPTVSTCGLVLFLPSHEDETTYPKDCVCHSKFTNI